jgi:hypothetical protein
VSPEVVFARPARIAIEELRRVNNIFFFTKTSIIESKSPDALSGLWRFLNSLRNPVGNAGKDAFSAGKRLFNF